MATNLERQLSASIDYVREQKRQRAGNYKHGLAHTKEWRTYCGMRYRCRNRNCKAWADYGGRGIRVCERWLASFPAFVEDMGRAPSPSHTIDRINNDGDYEPGNCRWATRAEQQNNKRNVHIYEFRGQTNTISGWAETLGLEYKTLQQRLLKYGWTVERALTQPLRPWAGGTGRKEK